TTRRRRMTPLRRIRLRAMMRGGSVTFALGALAVALAACGSSKSSSSSSSTTSSSTPATSSSTPTTAPVAATGPGVGKPGVTIGDKNFTEENILGQLYAQALGAKGYKVSVKENIGSSEIINKALTSGQIEIG